MYWCPPLVTAHWGDAGQHCRPLHEHSILWCLGCGGSLEIVILKLQVIYEIRLHFNGHWSIIMTMIISFGMQQIYLIFFKCRKSIDLFSCIFPAEKFVLYPAGRKWFWHKVYYPQDSRQEKLNFHWIHKKCILFFRRPEKYIKQIVFTPNFTHGPQCRYSSATWR